MTLLNTFSRNKGEHQKRQRLRDFLPYEPSEKTHERFKDGLHEYLLLLEIVQQAMFALQQGTLSAFDPLVGENFCQIRAVKIALIALHRKINAEELLKKSRLAKEKIEGFLQTCPNFFACELSLGQFVENEQIDIELFKDECFLIMSFVLTRTKVLRPFFKEDMPLVENAYTDSKKIKEMGQVGSSFSNEFVKKIRKQLSALSVEFVQQLSEKIDPRDTDPRLLSDQFLYLHKGLKCLSYYWGNKSLNASRHGQSNPYFHVSPAIR